MKTPPATAPASPASSITRLFRSGPSFEGAAPVAAVAPSAPQPGATLPRPGAPIPDLSGRTKVWMAIGPGRSGKTTLVRYLAETMLGQGRSALFAALDPQNRSLAAFLNDVEQPPSSDTAAAARWLEELLRFTMEEKQSALIDLGGGDTSLGRVLAAVPDMVDTMQAAGVAPVAVYLIGPRLDDLAPLIAMEAAGFQPAATALVLNLGLADPTVPPEEAFGWVLHHEAFRSAVARGAVPIFMPRLQSSVASEVEARRLHFFQARDGKAPDGQPDAVLGPFNRSRVRHWLTEMDAAFAPIRSWSP